MIDVYGAIECPARTRSMSRMRWELPPRDRADSGDLIVTRPMLSGVFGGFRFEVVGSPLRDTP